MSALMSTARDAGDGARTLALVERAVAGDRLAFDQLYTQHLDQVYRFILYRVADVSLAEDLTQEAFTHALRRIGAFTWQGGGFAAWLITIAKNLITDHHKCARTRLERPVGEMADADRLEADPAQLVMTDLVNRALRAALEQLCPAHRQVLQARYLAELSVRETAELMGKPEGAVKSCQYRAMHALRRLLTPSPPQEATP